MFRPDGGGSMTVSGLKTKNNLIQAKMFPMEQRTLIYGASDDSEVFVADWNAKPNEESGRVDIVNKVFSSEKTGRPCIGFDIYHENVKGDTPRDFILTINDFNFCIWRTDCDFPIFKSPYLDRTNNTCGCFSPTKPGIIFIGRQDGDIDIWDFLDQSYHPTQSWKGPAKGIASIQIDNEYLAVGDRDGGLTLLKLPNNMWKPKGNEQDIMHEIWMREYERVLYVQKRLQIRSDEHQKKIEESEKKESSKDLPSFLTKLDQVL